ncbi:MAG TPA: PQQ-dependent sugar dehydrogenase [Jatrophihabitantaceae bacterium]|jgi:glucose/arabinose dehydrogenase
MRRIPWRAVGLLASAGLLAGCAAGANAAPTWVPQPSITLEATPAPSAPNQAPSQVPSGPQAPAPNSPGAPRTPGGGTVGSGVLATGLNQPTGLVLLPDGSALVGERTTGHIVHVPLQPGQPVPVVKTITGLATSGDGGLLDLALSPTYAQDGLIYAYVTTPTDNRVIDFTLDGPVTPVLTGIPRGATDNTGRLLFDDKGLLYVGTGDAGSRQLAANPASLAGKVLRVDGIGQVAQGNPKPGSPVFTRGHRTVNGLCGSAEVGAIYETEAPAEINALAAGADYGWPTPHARSVAPAATLPAAHRGAAGCAIQQGTLYIATTDGRALLAAPLTTPGRVGTIDVVHLDQSYGRLRTVVAAPDGALWLTTSNRDGRGHPIPDDDRVIRLVPPPLGGGSPA